MLSLKALIKKRNLNKKTKGVVITEISNRSPLANLLSVNDIIIEVQKTPVKNSVDLNKMVDGIFKKGDHIRILDKNLTEYARGLSSFSSNEIIKIQGQHSKKINDLLGYISKSEVVHKDDMVEV